MLLSAVSGLAQQKPGTIAALEFQTPKNGMVKQYEDGRKQSHGTKNKRSTLLVWQILAIILAPTSSADWISTGRLTSPPSDQ
jgi:hypothetical protein